MNQEQIRQKIAKQYKEKIQYLEEQNQFLKMRTDFRMICCSNCFFCTFAGDADRFSTRCIRPLFQVIEKSNI